MDNIESKRYAQEFQELADKINCDVDFYTKALEVSFKMIADLNNGSYHDIREMYKYNGLSKDMMNRINCGYLRELYIKNNPDKYKPEDINVRFNGKRLSDEYAHKYSIRLMRGMIPCHICKELTNVVDSDYRGICSKLCYDVLNS